MVVAGCGFLGEAAASLFFRAGWSVLGLRSSTFVPGSSGETDVPVMAWDITQRGNRVPRGWDVPDVLIHCASSGRGGADAYRAIYRDGLRNLEAAFCPRKLIFTSSTSVYAQCDGSWVDEDSPAIPERETGRILLDAEAIACESGGLVARLSGLYGPGRCVVLQKFLAGTARIEDGGTRWINHIHRDDAAEALFLLATAEIPAGRYNVSDGCPLHQRDVFLDMAQKLHLPLPVEGMADKNRKRGWTSKRVSCEKMRSLGWRPQFPSLKEAWPLLVKTLPSPC